MTVEEAIRHIKAMGTKASETADERRLLGDNTGGWFQSGMAIGFERALIVLIGVKE